ncbi:MAG: alginate lyase family protein [Pseudomonadota bacterium]
MTNVTRVLGAAIKSGALFSLLIGSAWAQQPNLYLDQQEIDEIRQKIDAQESPWIQAYDDLLDRAQDALSESPDPVSGVYPNDKTPPRAHYQAITQDSNHALVLALAYVFTDDSQYAQKSRTFINAWVNNLDPVSSQYQQGIELSITLPSFFFAADLIWNSGMLTASEKTAFQDWARDFGYALINTESSCCGKTHNINNWEWAAELAAGVVSGEQYLIDRAIERFQSVTGSRYLPDGRFKSEGTRSFTYSFFALTALTTLAEGARHQGVDLYGYEVNGFSLQRAAFDHFNWYVDRDYPGSNPNYSEVTSTGYTGIAEIYHSLYGDAIYEEAIAEYGGRPTYDRWIFGPLTLTHGLRNLPVSGDSGSPMPPPPPPPPGANESAPPQDLVAD